MKKNYTAIVFGLLVFIFGFNSCKTTSSSKCPDLAKARTHYPTFAILRHKGSPPSIAPITAKEVPVQKGSADALSASSESGIPINLKLPKLVSKEIDEDKFEKINTVLNQYSKNKVSLARNAKGKIVLQASSAKELVKMTKAINQDAKSAAIDDNTKSILALVGGILGIVAIAFSLIPYLDFTTLFPFGPGAIVLGALGLHSDRHKWALLGIILGAVGIFLAIITVVVYTLFVFGAFII